MAQSDGKCMSTYFSRRASFRLFVPWRAPVLPAESSPAGQVNCILRKPQPKGDACPPRRLTGVPLANPRPPRFKGPSSLPTHPEANRRRQPTTIFDVDNP
ncbi:uncharacterized protein JN550_008337 [Neoarthrinium moseri]|uniref:uncharacterized protein n=1 Tax=Neoarthrinium moseri TaxID=1658444 RepID=UPI001FDAD16C|nr:uncharacterized protein JN550_008337 [Neoarthrinium moseri]KAI1865289.1 hypothetical protein JN550_008337 [Neoarthrinium moseri]